MCQFDGWRCQERGREGDFLKFPKRWKLSSASNDTEFYTSGVGKWRGWDEECPLGVPSTEHYCSNKNLSGSCSLPTLQKPPQGTLVLFVEPLVSLFYLLVYFISRMQWILQMNLWMWLQYLLETNMAANPLGHLLLQAEVGLKSPRSLSVSLNSVFLCNAYRTLPIIRSRPECTLCVDLITLQDNDSKWLSQLQQ